MKKEWKGALIGGIVGFLMPWFLLILSIIKGVPEIGINDNGFYLAGENLPL